MTRDCNIGSAATIFGEMSFYEAVEILEEYGIKVQDADDNFKRLSEILDELSKVWRRTASLSKSIKICEAAQRFISSFENASLTTEDNTAFEIKTEGLPEEAVAESGEVLDNFLKEFALKEVC